MDGTLAPEFGIREVNAGSTEDHTRPAVAAGKIGGFMVAWEYDRPGTSYQDIHGRGVTAPFFTDGFESGTLSAWSASFQ